MAKGKARWPKADASGPVISIDCRSVGPGGTTVDLRPTKDGVKAIWTNENCPYTGDGVTRDEHYAASDDHNVSHIGWERLAGMVEYARRQGWLK